MVAFHPAFTVALLALAGCGDKDGEPADSPEEDSAAASDSAPPEDSAPPAEADADGDGYSDAEDCHDGDPAINPGAPEVCDSLDNDCDGAADEGAIDAPTWYADADSDWYGDPAAALAACEQPPGYVADNSDCDDSDSRIRPGYAESCDGLDNDCDGAADEAALDARRFYGDADGDGYGDPSEPYSACAPPAGYVSNDDDCDDSDASNNPLAEICTCDDGADNDGDGLADCEDGDCAAEARCAEDCDDGGDDDLDGLTDCEDDDCWGTGACAEILTWVEAGSVEGGASFRFHSGSDGFSAASGTWTARWSRAWSVQGGISRHSTHGFSTTCTWTLESAAWQGSWRRGYEEWDPSGEDISFDLDRVARAGLALSPGCAIELPLEGYLPQYVGLGTGRAPGWGAVAYLFGPSGFAAAGWVTGWYVPGAWTSARVASTAYDPGSPSDSDLWLSTYRDTWSGTLTRGDSYYPGPP